MKLSDFLVWVPLGVSAGIMLEYFALRPFEERIEEGSRELRLPPGHVVVDQERCTLLMLDKLIVDLTCLGMERSD